MTIVLGYWVIPLILTAVVITIASLSGARGAGWLSGLDTALYLLVAVILSLSAWLVWAVLT